MTVPLRPVAEMSIVNSGSQTCWGTCAGWAHAPTPLHTVPPLCLRRNSRRHCHCHTVPQGTATYVTPVLGIPMCPTAWWPQTARAHGNVPVVTGTHTVTKQVFNLTVFLRWEPEKSRVNSWSAYPTKPKSVSIWLLFIAPMELALTEAAVSRSTLNKAVINVQSCTSTRQG